MKVLMDTSFKNRGLVQKVISVIKISTRLPFIYCNTETTRHQYAYLAEPETLPNICIMLHPCIHIYKHFEDFYFFPFLLGSLLEVSTLRRCVLLRNLESGFNQKEEDQRICFRLPQCLDIASEVLRNNLRWKASWG